MRWAFVLGLVAGCYGRPAAPPCAIECFDSCPGELTCQHGVCVGDGDTCTPTFATVHAGNAFACALDTLGIAWCWGANTHHQITSSPQSHVDVATAIGNDRWDDLATGGGHVCGLRGGELFCWGANDRGQVSSAIAGDVLAPLQIQATPPVGAWTAVAAGFDETCAIGDGHLYCWGANGNGQLGNNTTSDIGVPTLVASTIADWTSVATGPDHSCAISSTAGLMCWGNNLSGQLGNGTTTPSLVPIAASLASPARVTVGLATTCAITVDGTLLCWGDASTADLGDPSLVAEAGIVAVPAPASGLTGWTDVHAAESLTCGQRGEEVWCWGTTRGGGGLANGVWTANATGWGRVLDGASNLAVGWNANFDDAESCNGIPGPCDRGDLDLGCAIVSGEVQCWGNNDFGQLALGGATMQTAPAEIVGDHRWKTLVAGTAHACGIDDAGVPYCWGATTDGQVTGLMSGSVSIPCGEFPDRACDVGVPTALPFLPAADALSVGRRHTCALASGTVTCWGDDSFVQLGTPSAPDPSPRAVPGGPYDALFEGGGNATCAKRGADTVCWGEMFAGASAPYVEPSLAGATAFVMYGVESHGHACALDASGALGCFGDNQRGQYGNGHPGACGDGTCNVGEDPTVCPSDCNGANATCGDGTCDANETPATCAADCGAGPIAKLARTYSAIAIGREGTNTYTTACGVTPEGTVECWGKTTNGQAGLLPDPTYGQQFTPFVLPGLAGCTAVTVSDLHACAICGGSVYCWGDNARGGVGDGAPTSVPVTAPRELALPAGDPPVQLVSGTGFSCARTQAGRAYCWGSSLHGALGGGAASANLPTPIRLAP